MTSKEYAIILNSGLVAVLTRAQPNILVDTVGHARITDFGQTTVVQDLDHIRGASSDLGHTAPEILNEEGTYSKDADVFSFAMVMIEVRQGRSYCLSKFASLMSRVNTGVHRYDSVQR